MRASLVSATSLLALLLVDEAGIALFASDAAYATPTITQPSAINFNYAVVGNAINSSPEVITITGSNSANTTLTIGALTSPFSPLSGSTYTLGTTNSNTVTQTFTFTPTTTGSVSGKSVVSDSGSGTSRTITLSGTGVAPLASVNSTGVNLGYALVNNQSVTTVVTVSNIGNGNLVKGTSGNLVGTIGAGNSVFSGTASAFSLNDKNYNSVNATTTAVTTATNTYTFAPTSRGVASDVVVTTISNGLNARNVAGALSTTLTGTGVAPVAAISTSATTYVLVGQTGTTTVSVSNTGDGNLSGRGTVSNLRGTLSSASGTGFTGSGSVVSLADGSVSSTGYAFTPTVKGATASAMVVAALANGSTDGANNAFSQTLALTGTGVAPVASITTGSPTYVLVGQTGTSNVTVTNTGNGNLSGQGTLSNLRGSLSTASGTGFSGTAGTVSLGDGSTTSFSYTYTPTIRGASTGSVTAALSDGSADGTNAAGTQTLALTGTGVAPVASIASSSQNYFLVGQTGTATISVSNTGDGNKSGSGTISNLRGSLSAATGAFAGAANALSLGDTSSTNYNYTFTPTLKGATATATVIATLSNGAAAGTNAAFTQTVGLSGTGVAPVQATSTINSTTPIIARVGTSVTTTVATISNTGNGNLSGLGSVSNLNASVAGTVGSGVSTTTSTISLADSASTTLAYTYAPISRGTVSSTALISYSNGNSAGTNASQTVSSVFLNQGVSPVYTSSISGSGATNTPTAVANGSIGAASSSISFGTVGYKQSATIYLALKNTSTDAGAASLTNLSIERYSIAGAGAAYYSVSNTGVITESGQLLVPITVTNLYGAGLLNSSLTIFTDESAALGGVGDTFTYALTAFAVPEPATLAILGAGLAGLASMRRRRR